MLPSARLTLALTGPPPQTHRRERSSCGPAGPVERGVRPNETAVQSRIPRARAAATVHDATISESIRAMRLTADEEVKETYDAHHPAVISRDADQGTPANSRHD